VLLALLCGACLGIIAWSLVTLHADTVQLEQRLERQDRRLCTVETRDQDNDQKLAQAVHLRLTFTRDVGC
jgi:hypothetical protein